MEYLDRKFNINNDEAPSAWDQLSFWSAPFGKLLLDHVPMHQGARVLDLGCGAGFPSIELAGRLGSKSKVIGFDCWREGLERARGKAAWMGLQNVEFIEGNGINLPFENGSFNLIVSNLGINNFEEQEKVTSECFRILERQGKFCLTTNLTGHYREFYKEYESTLKELNLGEFIPQLQEQEKHRGSDESIRNLLEDGGFSIVKMVRDRFHIRFVDGSALLNHFLTVLGFLDGWRSILPKDKEQEVFSDLENRLNKLADWEGELKMTVPMLYVEALK